MLYSEGSFHGKYSITEKATPFKRSNISTALVISLLGLGLGLLEVQIYLFVVVQHKTRYIYLVGVDGVVKVSDSCQIVHLLFDL